MTLRLSIDSQKTHPHRKEADEEDQLTPAAPGVPEQPCLISRSALSPIHVTGVLSVARKHLSITLKVQPAQWAKTGEESGDKDLASM